MPGTALNAGSIAMSKTDKTLPSLSLNSWGGRKIKTIKIIIIRNIK